MASTSKKASAAKAAAPQAAADGSGAATTVKGKPKESTGNADTTESKDDTAKAAAGHATKPDVAAYQAEQDRLKAEIDAVQAKLNAVKDKIALTTKDSPAAERRTTLRAEQDALRSQQSNSKASRGKTLDQINAIKETVHKRVKDLQAAKTKANFHSVAEVDSAIKALDRQVESGSMTIAQEKRALAEISTYKRARKAIENFQVEQDTIEAERAKVDALQKELDDPEAKALSDRYDTIRAELDQIKKESDEAYASRNKLFDERNEYQKELSVLHEKKRDIVARHREANDIYWQKVNEDRARKAERYRAQRAADEDAKRKEVVERLREEGSAPAFSVEIEDCQTLIDYFSKMLAGGGAAAAAAVAVPASLVDKADVAGVPKLELRTVQQTGDKGLVARKRKGDDDETYFVGGKGKVKKGAAPKSAVSGDAAAAPTPKSANAQLNVPLPTLTALLALSIPPPTSQADVPRAVEDLRTKKAWFEANQKRITAENVAKAEEKIRALEGGPKSQTKTSTENGHAEALVTAAVDPEADTAATAANPPEVTEPTADAAPVPTAEEIQ